MFLCDPEKNTACKKGACQTFCFLTRFPEYAKQTIEGDRIKAFIDLNIPKQMRIFPEPEEGKCIVSGYKTFHLGRWKTAIDNDETMLECPECESRIIWRDYERAIGTKGIRFCPYCGADLWD